MSDYIAGLDLGQSQDYTALAILQVIEHDARSGAALPEPLYHLRHLERPPLGTSYPAIVARVRSVLASAPLAGNTTLIADKTGVGRPVMDMLRASGLRASLIPVTITGGATVGRDPDGGGGWHVPKRDLASALAVVMQSGRLKVVPGLPLGQTLIDELLNFKVKISASGHDSYAAGGMADWRDGAHDDLVLSVALAIWHASRRDGGRAQLQGLRQRAERRRELIFAREAQADVGRPA